MSVLRRGPLRLACLVLLASVAACEAASSTQTDPEDLRNAKALYFDRRYAEAREAWQAILASSPGGEAEAAAYWVARCSEHLGEDERAFREYGEYLARRLSDRVLAEEARTARVGLAARLYRAGRKDHLAVLKEALGDPSKTVRYYAALQLSSLGGVVGQAAIPVLKQILGEEKDPDLVERAKLGLLRVDPRALTQVPDRRASSPRREATWIKVRIFKKGGSRPEVSINMPMAFAELLFKSLPDEAKQGLRRKGYDADNFWERLNKLAPSEILSIETEEGERIQIWLE